MKNNTFRMFVGPMFSSKTSHLMSALEKCKYQQKSIVVYKPSIDDRYSTSDVVTHNGFKWPATVIKTGEDIFEHLSNPSIEPNVIAVDEAFMIPDVADALIWLYRNGIDIIVSSLDMSSSCKPFKEIEKMFPWATHIEKCTAVCTVCGEDAHFTHKKNISDQEIEVGGSDLYEPRCHQHHPNFMLKVD